MADSYTGDEMKSNLLVIGCYKQNNFPNKDSKYTFCN